MPRVAVVDYGSSNLRSVAKALEHVANGEHEVIVSSDRQVILNADRIVFPGQGAIISRTSDATVMNPNLAAIRALKSLK